jgi:hypothetical protein
MYSLFIFALLSTGWLVYRMLMARRRALAPVRVRR